MHHAVVDCHPSRSGVLDDPVDSFLAVGEDVQTQRVVDRTDHLHRIFHAVDSDNRQQRAEDLFFHNPRGELWVLDHCGDKQVVCLVALVQPPVHHFSAIIVEQSLDPFPVVAVDDARVAGVVLLPVGVPACHHSFDFSIESFFLALVQQHIVRGQADLATVDRLHVQHSLDSLLDVAVLVDEDRGLASKLQRDRGEVFCSSCHHDLRHKVVTSV
mmetsp:Transcript_49163/g.96372  ORF Transcript_49163/g.96372 Transcript_49163/m.96372 type:complete len:214 (+) Transcript_49163:524-1165(+)